MKEKGPRVWRPKEKETESNVPPLESVEKLGAERIAEAKEQLEMIAPSLRELARTIESEQPDCLIFLDISARLLASPYKKYLSDKMGRKSPLIRYYNDHNIKGDFLDGKDLHERADKDFGALHGKKVFFIDETFSEGKGAGAVLSATELAGIDARYFALTRDPDPPHSEEAVAKSIAKKIEHLKEEGRIHVYENPIRNLFSRFGSRLYVDDAMGSTVSLHKEPEAAAKNNIPNARDYVRPPEGMTVEEYERASSRKLGEVGREMKEMIYDAIKANK